MKCPQCYTQNPPGATECERCAVVFKHLNRSAATKTDSASIYCAWSDHGSRCPCRGLISSSTGGGSFYCREHWERINNREPYGVGNALGPAEQSYGAKSWHEAMAAHRARVGVRSPLAQYAAREFLPGETVAALQERIRAEPRMAREPGADDE